MRFFSYILLFIFFYSLNLCLQASRPPCTRRTMYGRQVTSLRTQGEEGPRAEGGPSAETTTHRLSASEHSEHFDIDTKYKHDDDDVENNIYHQQEWRSPWRPWRP